VTLEQLPTAALAAGIVRYTEVARAGNISAN
jgi:hypothetical protein